MPIRGPEGLKGWKRFLVPVVFFCGHTFLRWGAFTHLDRSSG